MERRSRWIAGLAAVTAAGVAIALFASDADDDRDRGLPVTAVGEPSNLRGEIIVARGRYSNGQPYEFVAERDGRTSLCTGLGPGISMCDQRPSPENPLSVHTDESGCPDTVLQGQTLASAHRVEVIHNDGRVIDAHTFPIPRELGHDGVLFVALQPGTVGLRRVRAIDEDGDEVAATTVPDQSSGSAC